MSQKVSRKSTVNEDKDKRNADSPVKEMKKKMAANADKEKQAADKVDKTEKSSDKVADKPTEKKVAEKSTDKKVTEKPTEKPDKSEKVDKKEDKKSEKKDTEKKSDKPEPQAEKSKEGSKEDKNAKPEKEKPEAKKAEPSKPRQNGDRVHNGVSDVTLGNGDDVPNGTVKATRTPETPRPASDKQSEKDADDPKEKVLKLKEDAPATDRKLRSADSPKPQDKKQEKEEVQKKEGEKNDGKDVVGDKSTEKSQEEKIVEIVVEVEVNEGEEPQRKTDTNFSKSRVKVSPYRRSMRLADQTNTSVIANYTGNNTTMEMDITESSSFMEDTNLDDSSYLRGLRSIRGRSSYKPLKEITLKHVANRSTRSNVSSTVSENSRPTGTVVGRKRKPELDDSPELAVDALADRTTPVLVAPSSAKRMRVLERLAEPFRRAAALSLPAHRRNADIVGINTDLPLTAPVASTETFDPETLKPDAPVAVPLAPDNKRCSVM